MIINTFLSSLQSFCQNSSGILFFCLNLSTPKTDKPIPKSGRAEDEKQCVCNLKESGQMSSRGWLTKPSKTQLRLYGMGVCHDETNLYSPVFKLKESEELQGRSCSQRQPGLSIDCHFQGQTVLGVIIEYPVKYNALVVHCKLCKLVDGSQISQTSISVDIKVVELHIWCEVLV